MGQFLPERLVFGDSEPKKIEPRASLLAIPIDFAADLVA
jgi:hypothetical protein